MDAFDTYRIYQSIRLHFDSDTYDAIKYNFKTSISVSSFRKRKDQYFFTKIGEKFKNRNDLIYYFVSHFIADNKWIGDIIGRDDIYKSWMKRNQALTYKYEQDLIFLRDTYSESFDELMNIKDSTYPMVILALLSDEITIESVVILNRLTSFMDVANKKITETILWPQVYKKISKYGSFVNIDDTKYKNIIFKIFTI